MNSGPEPTVSRGTREWVVCHGRCVMKKAMKNLVSKLVADDRGGEVLEYALIAGLIVVAAIASISAVGGKVVARWTSMSDGSW